MSVGFDLTSNPFHLLAVSARAMREDIVAAHDDALADGQQDEATLQRAQQALLAPRTRVEAEVAWLVGLAPSRAKEIVSRLADGRIPEVGGELERLQGLDLANFAADLCCRAPGTPGLVDLLLRGWRDITPEAVTRLVNDNRGVANFPLIDDALASSALPVLRKRHAEAALKWITAAKHPGNAMTAVVEKYLGVDAGSVHALLDDIVKDYDAWSAPTLRRIQEQIDDQVAALRAKMEDASPVARIDALLAEWDEFSQPAQLVEQAKGHDERRSHEIYRQLRELCLWLANEKKRFEAAHAISKAVLRTFPELPSVAIQVRDDLETLESLVAQAQTEEHAGPLIEVTELAKASIMRLQQLRNDLLNSGFGTTSRGLAEELFQAFARAAQGMAGSEHAMLPYGVVRNLAVELNNTGDSPAAAIALLKGAVDFQPARPNAETLHSLASDLRDLNRNMRFGELAAAAKSNDTTRALGIADELLRDTTGEDNAQLTALRAGLASRRSARQRKWIIWGLLVFGGVIWWAISDADKSARPYRATYTPPQQPTYSQLAPTPTPSTDTAPPPAVPVAPRLPPPTAAGFTERKPSVGTNEILDREQIRYCVFQGERLDLVRDRLTSNAAIARFNAAIGDLNARCASFRYRHGLLQTVEAEVPGRRDVLRREAEELLATLQGTVMPTRVPPAAAMPPVSRPSATPDAPKFSVWTAEGAVRAQDQLRLYGFYNGASDGIWGPASREALQRFKASRGLPANDAWDAATEVTLLGR